MSVIWIQCKETKNKCLLEKCLGYNPKNEEGKPDCDFKFMIIKEL